MSDEERKRRLPNPARVEEFAATARRLQQERETASIIEQALRDTPRDQWPALAQRKDLHTSGVLERLAKIADDLERDPQKGLAVAELATSIAETLSEDAYPRVLVAQLRAHAWKDCARTLSYLSRYEEALAALERAERYVSAFGTLAHDRAIVHFVRSIVLQHLRRFDEAQALLAECREVFKDHGDMRLYGKCTLAWGNLLLRRGDHAAASEIVSTMLSGADAQDEAVARSTLGWCAIHLGHPDDALAHFNDAMRRYQRLDWDIEVIRAAAGKGCALLRLGRLDEAIEILEDARERFLDRSLVEAAGLCGLEIVEARMLRDEFDEAKTLAATIVQEFAKANLNRRAVAALASLNEAMAANSATPDFVRNVHAYLCALGTDPTQDFKNAN